MNSKYIYAIAAVVVLGMWTSKLKTLSIFSPNTAKLTRLDIRAMDYEMYQRSHLENDREETQPQAKPYHLAGLGTFKKDELFARPRVQVEKKAVVAEEKAKDKKKKKKKKADAIARLRSEANSATVVYKENHKPSTRNDQDVSSSTFETGAAIQAPVKPEDQDSKDIAEWTARLLARPDKEAVTEFIRDYQTNRISEMVFYTLIDKMYAERSTDFKSLAVLAAGSVSSLRSYDFLVKALSDESAGAAIASQSQTELQEYAALTSVSVLRQVLSVHLQDEVKIEIAMRAIDVSTAYYLRETPRGPSAVKAQIFSSFIVPLEAALKVYAQNAAVTDPGQRALQRIKSANNTVAQVGQ